MRERGGGAGALTCCLASGGGMEERVVEGCGVTVGDAISFQYPK